MSMLVSVPRAPNVTAVSNGFATSPPALFGLVTPRFARVHAWWASKPTTGRVHLPSDTTKVVMTSSHQ